MILHVRPGDATVDKFKASGVEGEIDVCPECLAVGDVSGITLQDFWENRARVLAAEYPDARSDYRETVVHKFAKLTALGSDSEIDLWFELNCSAR
ncbi:MAG: hypothetical protein ABI646_04815 [Acidobacteriota bacterium]